eukprot:CAMPEP_0119335156 /NCGR_PEP_ID=MMETSP1333-20130426/88863_1 /TAXON_ID=418940 /ORGANISM="Scyphosphaera apsteinii, Strain RCC1455" /LENGTH=120 /DNA_ID=CAMNT_0007345629 /DNA_START=12 /DNA_END=371 /DNA_ORIENTATION=+
MTQRLKGMSTKLWIVADPLMLYEKFEKLSSKSGIIRTDRAVTLIDKPFIDFALQGAIEQVRLTLDNFLTERCGQEVDLSEGVRLAYLRSTLMLAFGNTTLKTTTAPEFLDAVDHLFAAAH